MVAVRGDTAATGEAAVCTVHVWIVVVTVVAAAVQREVPIRIVVAGVWRVISFPHGQRVRSLHRLVANTATDADPECDQNESFHDPSPPSFRRSSSLSDTTASLCRARRRF